MSDDDGAARRPPTPDPDSGPDPGAEPIDADGGRWLSRRARWAANVAIGLLVVTISALAWDGGSLSRLYATFLLVSAPLLLGYRGSDAVSHPLAGVVAFVGLLMLVPQLSAPAAAATVRLTGMDPVSARFATDHAVDNVLTLALLEGTLWAWLLAPATRALVSGSPPSLPGLPHPPRGSRRLLVAAAIVVTAGTLSAGFAAGYYPVTTLETPGGTYEHAGVAVTVTGVERFDADTPVSVDSGDLVRAEPVPESGEIVLVRVRTHDRGTKDAVSPEVRLVTPAADEGDRVRERIDTVVRPSGNPLFAGTEVPAERVRVAGRTYTVYDPDNRTGRTNEGWILFRRPVGADDAGSYIRIRTGDPGPAGKWRLGSG